VGKSDKGHRANREAKDVHPIAGPLGYRLRFQDAAAVSELKRFNARCIFSGP
jgi:hypothetical protein